jgi:hypothetical protein
MATRQEQQTAQTCRVKHNGIYLKEFAQQRRVQITQQAVGSSQRAADSGQRTVGSTQRIMQKKKKKNYCSDLPRPAREVMQGQEKI